MAAECFRQKLLLLQTLVMPLAPTSAALGQLQPGTEGSAATHLWAALPCLNHLLTFLKT